MAKIGVFALFQLLPTLAAATALIPTYGTYFGGAGSTNGISAVALDPLGNVVVAGYTSSQTLPGTANALQPTLANGTTTVDVFIAKFNPSGTTLLWATFLGGNGLDMPTALAVDSVGSIYVVGTTGSSNFPVTSNAYLSSYSSGSGFASKISADGRSLLYSTYLPGTPNASALSRTGEIYIAGIFSPNVVSLGALGNNVNFNSGQVYNGVFLILLNATGTNLVFGAYLGGGGNPFAVGSKVMALALDGQGNVYVTGLTDQSDIPTTSNALQQFTGSQGPCCTNGFIVEVNSIGSQVVYGTYFGPQYFPTAINSLALGADGSLYFTGTTTATTLQATQGAYLSMPAQQFVAKLTPGRSALDALSYIPGVSGFSPLVQLGNQPQKLYVAFVTTTGQYAVPVGFSVVELSAANLALTSIFISSSKGFPPLGFALSGPHSLWLVGFIDQGSGCLGVSSPCTMGQLISGDAIQNMPESSESGVLVQLTDEPPPTTNAGIFRQGFLWILDVNGNELMDIPPDLVYAFGGIAGDIPITGDWNGDGHTKIGIYRSRNGLFILDTNGDGMIDTGDQIFTFVGAGQDPGDVPVVGDWNGDGRTKIGIFRQGFLWILDSNGDGVFEPATTDKVYPFGGNQGDVPIVGDWTGTGTSKIGIFRQGFLWILDANGDGVIDAGDYIFPFGGIPGDVPIAGDWNGNGISKVGLFRQGFLWVLDANGDQQIDAGDYVFAYGGFMGDKPVTGKW